MIHIGEVIAILDVHSAHSAKSENGEKNFIAWAEKEGKVEKIAVEEVKSYVITCEKVYASPISSITLKKRAEMNVFSKK